MNLINWAVSRFGKDDYSNAHYNDFAGRNGSGLCRDATMLRDKLVELIEPQLLT
jgi:hypothetical protein